MKNVIIASIIFICISTEVSSSEISEFAKALLYAEEGLYGEANRKLAPYEITYSAIVSMMKAKMNKDEKILIDGKFKTIPQIEEKLKDRINYEIAKILFEKGEIDSSKEYLSKIQNKNTSSVMFAISNIQLLEGDTEQAHESFRKIRKESADDLSYKKLEKSVKENTSVLYIEPQIKNSLFFGKLPVLFKDKKYRKNWDIVSQLFGKIKADILPSKNISPFISYDLLGELYTEIYGFTIHKVSAGVEYKKSIPIGGAYSLNLIAYGTDIFGTSHKLSPYIFPTKNLYVSISGEIQTFDKVPEREGPIIQMETISNLSWKIGSAKFQSIPALSVGKRFSKSPKFSELFAYLYLGNTLSLSEKTDLNLNGFAMFSNYPEDFERRKTNIYFTISPSICLNEEYFKWEMLKPMFQFNYSDAKNFSWNRILIGTALEFVF